MICHGVSWITVDAQQLQPFFTEVNVVDAGDIATSGADIRDEDKVTMSVSGYVDIRWVGSVSVSGETTSVSPRKDAAPGSDIV